MSSDKEWGILILGLVDKVWVGQAPRPGPDLQLGIGECLVQFAEVREDQLWDGSRGHFGDHAPVHVKTGDVNNVEG